MSKLVYFMVLFGCMACVEPPCMEDNRFNFDRYGRPLPKQKKNDPPAYRLKRCSISNCKTKKIHCHGNSKVRGSAWWLKQNPAVGE